MAFDESSQWRAFEGRPAAGIIAIGQLERAPPHVRWSIDAADAYSVAKVRRAVIKQLETLTEKGADLYAVETVLGELLGAEMQRGHFAVAVIIEGAVGGPTVHIYTQGTPSVNSTQGELRDALLHGTRLPMSVESTPQGTHITLRVPTLAEEEGARRPR